MTSQQLLWEKKKYRDDLWKKYNRRRIENELDMFFDDLIEPIIEVDDNKSHSTVPDVIESSDDGSSSVGNISGVPRGIMCKESHDDASSVGNFSLDEQSYSYGKIRTYSSFGNIPRKFTASNPKRLSPYRLSSFDEGAGPTALRSSLEEEEGQEETSLSSNYFSVATSSRGNSGDSGSLSGTSFYTTDNSSIISLKARKRRIERSVARYPDYCN